MQQCPRHDHLSLVIQYIICGAPGKTGARCLSLVFTPCAWTEYGIVALFLNTTWTLSPTSTLRMGPERKKKTETLSEIHRAIKGTVVSMKANHAIKIWANRHHARHFEGLNCVYIVPRMPRCSSSGPLGFFLVKVSSVYSRYTAFLYLGPIRLSDVLRKTFPGLSMRVKQYLSTLFQDVRHAHTISCVHSTLTCLVE